jgi:hypothetical protein
MQVGNRERRHVSVGHAAAFADFYGVKIAKHLLELKM